MNSNSRILNPARAKLKLRRRTSRLFLLAAAAFVLSLGLRSLLFAANQSETYDLVISNGRVMDPESGLDAVRNIGITDGKIRAIAGVPLVGRQTIDAKSFVVAPGFIDLHEHGQEPRNYQFQAHDGVTTSLEGQVVRQEARLNGGWVV